MTLFSDPGFGRLLEQLAGFDLPQLDGYKERCLGRRLAVRMRACGVTTLGEYADLVVSVPGEIDRLREAITINVTGFFRNPEVWLRLQSVLAAEAGSTPLPRRAWSAGCSSGEEPWSLAMLLAEVAPPSGPAQPGFLIDATDLDEPSLTVARRGEYPAAAGADVPPHLLARWTRPTEAGLMMVPPLMAAVRFLAHDMSRAPAPGQDYDLVLCRNVLIYFSRELQEKVFRTFAKALRPGGLLVLGKVEAPSGDARGLFETVDGRDRIYRRVQ